MAVERTFVAAVKERYTSVVQAFDRCVLAVATDLDELDKEVRRLNQRLIDLESILPTTHRPAWVRELRQKTRLTNVKVSESIAKDLNQYFVRHHHLIQPILVEKSNALPNFDAIFDELRAQSRLPELFDQMAATLEKIIACKDIDSVIVIRTLQKLLDLLKANRDGSHTSLFSLRYFRRVLWNICRNTVDKSVLAKSFVQSYEQLDKEADVEQDKLQADLQHAAVMKVLENVDVERMATLEMTAEGTLALESIASYFEPAGLLEESTDSASDDEETELEGEADTPTDN